MLAIIFLSSDVAGYAFYVPNVFVKEDEESEGERVKISVPDDFKFTAQDKSGENKVELSAYQLFKYMDGTESSAYQTERSAEQTAANAPSEENGWHYVSVDEKAKIAEYGERTMFRMPQGDYDGYCYYIPNGLLRANKDKGTIRVSLPENFVVTVHNKQIKPYVKNLLNDFTIRFGNFPLGEYGWEIGNVRDDLAKFIPDEEISKYAQELAYEERLHEEIDERLEEIVWLNGRTEGFDKELIPDIINDLKPDFENSFFNKSGEGDYDEWYDEFAEEILAPYLETKAVDNTIDLTKPNYYGKDTSNAAFYYLPSLSYDTLPEIKEQAESYIIAAPVSYLSDEITDKYNIFFLKTDRDITMDELKNKDTAIGSMQTAVHNVVEARHKEYINALNLHTDCKNAIDKAISENYDGMHLKDGFENALIDKYGMGEINYVLANTVQYFYDDGRISRDNKAWANKIEITENEGHRYQFTSNTHRAILDGFIDRMRKKQRELLYGNKREEYYSVMQDTVNGKDEYTPVYVDANTGEIGTLFKRSFDTEKEINELIAKVNNATDVPREYTLVYITPEELKGKSDEIKRANLAKSLQGKFLSETKQGYRVVNITKDRDERNIAIIYRQTVKDFIVAPRYDTSDGTWAQSYYFKSLEAAERDRAETYGDNPKIYENKEWNKMPENEKPKWLDITVSAD